MGECRKKIVVLGQDLTRLAVASAVVHQPGNHVSEHLDDLNDDNDRENRDDHDVILETVVAVVHGHLPEATAALENAIDRIERKLGSLPVAPTTDGGPAGTLGGGITLPDPFETEITPWLLRRLDASTNIAIQVRDDAARVLMLMDEAVAKADTRG